MVTPRRRQRCVMDLHGYHSDNLWVAMVTFVREGWNFGEAQQGQAGAVADEGDLVTQLGHLVLPIYIVLP